MLERDATATRRIIEADVVGACVTTGVKISALDKLCWNWQTRQSPDLTGPSVDDLVAPFAARELVVVVAAVGPEILGDKPPCRCADPTVEP